MSKPDADASLSGANPVSRARLAGARLDAAEQELVAAIVDTPSSIVDGAPAVARRRRAGRARYVPLGLAGAAAVLLVVLSTSGGGGLTGTPASAFATQLARLAKTSPVVVVRRPSGQRPHPQGRERLTNVTISVYDCSHRRCVRMPYRRAVAAGIVPRDLHPERFPADVKLVVAPSEGK